MKTTKRGTPTPRKTALTESDLTEAVRSYVRTYVVRHGRRQATETFGVSRQTLWRFMDRGHMGRAALDAVVGSVEALEAATQGLATRPAASKPVALVRPPPRRSEDALVLLCATPLATVGELAHFGRVPTSTLRDRLEKLVKMGLVDSVPHRLGVLSPHPQRRYFPTDNGIDAATMTECGLETFLREYPVSRQWFCLLAQRVDAVAKLYRVAALVADADPQQKPVRVDHYRQGPYDALVTLSMGRSVGLLHQGPTLPSANLRYRLRSLENLPSKQRPTVTLVLTHSDQANHRAVRTLGDVMQHRTTFVATEGELLARDHRGVVWQQCSNGLGDNPPVEVAPSLSLDTIITWTARLAETSTASRRDRPKPDPEALYPDYLKAVMPEPSEQLRPALAVQLSRAEKDALDLLAAWPLCTTDQLAGLTGGVTRRRANQVLRSLKGRSLVRSDGQRHVLTDEGYNTWPGGTGPPSGRP